MNRAHNKPPTFPLLALVCGALLTLSPAAVAKPPLPSFKIHLEQPGIYRVSWENLSKGGLRKKQPASDRIGLTHAGEPVPLWVEDGGDGVFGPGDWIEFWGERLPGEVSYSSEHSRQEVYFLRLDAEDPARMHAGSSPEPIKKQKRRRGPPESAGYRSEQHLEQDLVLLRLQPTSDGRPQELWYWEKLSHIQGRPTRLSLDLHDLEAESTETVDLRLQFRGWSKPSYRSDSGGLTHHRVEVSLNGEPLTADDWDGTDPHLLEIPAIPAARLKVGENVVSIRVPRRYAKPGGPALVDVVMLNWIEVSYPRSQRVGDHQARFGVAASRSQPIRLLSAPERELVVYGAGGSRTVTAGKASKADGGDLVSLVQTDPAERSFIATHPENLFSPDGITRDHPSRLADTGNRADYLMIAHRTLIPTIEPLAEFHRSRGLAVEVVDVEDVYDEFHHGVVHPRALRSFVEHAYYNWQRPAPRFVLLVGDASWDAKNELVNNQNYADWTFRPRDANSFLKNQMSRYERKARHNRRGLVPTWSHSTSHGHSASDNYFVTVEGDDKFPDLAIGRMPVVEPEKVAGIVAKTIRYASTPEVGPWRRHALFITNDDPRFQLQSDEGARLLSARGFASQKVYPESDEITNARHTRQLVESFNEGKLFVHFLGHGGRYIWRTGPPDLAKNHDLFGLNHLDQLEPTERLPVVLSLACYSAPFDHPNADSIGEKLLRITDRGAVAVLAASWRNGPSPAWGQALLEELTKPGATVGEAVMRAKHIARSPMFVQTYNLLGDPAVPVALPAGEITLAASPEDGGALDVRGEIELDGFAGELLLEVVDENGEILSASTLESAGGEFALRFDAAGDELDAARAVRAYAWNADLDLDAAGTLELEAPETAATASTGATTAGTPTTSSDTRGSRP